MFLNRRTTQLIRSIVVMAAAGTIMASGCSSTQIQAVLVGVGAAADDLSRSSSLSNRNFSLGDWLPPALSRL